MLASAIVCVSATAGRAATDPVEAALAAARAEVEAGRCEQAEALLAPIAGLENRARLLGGQCLIRAGRYPEALANLDRARGARDLSGSQVGDVELYRGVALYHLERYAEATAALVAAEGITSEPAELALYRGLIALRGGDNERAAPDLEAAALLSPALTEPVASYYAGLAWQGAADRSKARAAFERVIAIDGEDGAWGRQARELLGATDPHPYYVRGSLGVEYDDNVILRGGATQFTSPDSPSVTRDGERDWRGVWTVDGGIQLVDQGSLGAGITAGYSGNAHADLADFNTHYPRIGGYVVNRLSPETTMQLRYEFGAAWVDEKSFLRTQLAEAGLSHAWEKAGTTVVVADFLWNDLRFPTRNVLDGPGAPGGDCDDPGVLGNEVAAQCGPPGLDEGRARDRDGEGVGAAIEQRYSVPLPTALAGALEALRVAGGYRYRYYVSQGREWKHMSHIASAAIELELPLDIRLSTRFSYEFRDFANPSTFPDRQVVDQQYTLSGSDRREHEVNLTAELEKDLTRNLSLSTRWSYLDNESNRRVYDYTRHIVGAYVNVRFD
ncbi:MAG: hypothetical protein IPK00_09865 [Deltaproteobacteria bacterium]|nr:hypothetical protein [Deltaproteobacteria bacterium]